MENEDDVIPHFEATRTLIVAEEDLYWSVCPHVPRATQKTAPATQFESIL